MGKVYPSLEALSLKSGNPKSLGGETSFFSLQKIHIPTRDVKTYPFGIFTNLLPHSKQTQWG